MIYTKRDDGIKGERIVCEFRRYRGPYLVPGSSAHRSQRIIIEGLPAFAVIEKPVRFLK